MTARRNAVALGAIFFLSGAASLLLETLWFRLCGLVFGNTAWASAIVLGAFMAGLALGNFLSPNLKFRAPVEMYALLETTIAISGLALVLILPVVPSVLAPLFRQLMDTAWLNMARLIFGFALLVIPSTMMGATLPTMVSALSQSDANFGRVLGLLYGCNTIGAVAGALAGELFLIGTLGIRGTGIVAAVASLTAAAFAVLISKVGGQPSSAVHAAGDGCVPTPLKLLAAASLSGFALLALEVIWFRFVILFVMSTSLSFAVMLAVVLAGIGLGAMFASYALSRWPDADRVLPIVAAGSVFAVVLSYAGFAPHPQGFRLFAVVIDSLRLMFPVSLLSGFLFTAVGRATERAIRDEVRAAAMTTLANTVGAALGSLAAGFVMLPTLGIERSMFAIGIVYAIVALLTFTPVTPRRTLIAMSVVAVLSLAFFPFGLLISDFLPFATRHYDEGRLVALREGPTETAAYLRTDYAGLPYMYRLVTNGYSMSATNFNSKRYMSAFVYLPLALRPHANTALLISYGVGITAKRLTESEQLQSIDVVDISRNILDLSYLAWPGKTNPLEDPRVRAHIEDGRFFLLGTKRKFDLITAEPPPPKGLGIVNLYTREYFGLVYDRLNDGGIVSYWLPAYQMLESDNKAIIRGFCDVFADCSLWDGAGAEFILVGSRGAARTPTAEEFSQQWRRPIPAEHLRRIGIESPPQMAALFIADAPMLRRLTASSPPLTDNHPLRLSTAPVFSMPSFVLPFIDGAERAFSQSAFAQRTLPAEIRAAAGPFFRTEHVIDRVLMIPFGRTRPPANVLRMMLTTTHLRTLPRILMGTDEWLEDIARIARTKGDRDPRLAYLLAVGALSDRDYVRASALFDEASRGMPNNAELKAYGALAKSLTR